METKVFLDFSSVIWDENHFKTDTAFHYKLASEVVLFIQAFESCNNLKLIARAELLSNAVGKIPIVSKSSDLFDFRKRATTFISQRFSDSIVHEVINKTVICNPNFCCDYFDESLKTEIRSLIVEMHYNEDTHVFCTFRTRWNWYRKQNSLNNTSNKKHTTVIHEVSKPTVKDLYFNTIRNIFEHNAKHDKNKGKRIESGNWVFPLSCFDGTDTDIPQRLLDSAIQYENEFYNYDDVNQTFVCFKNHLNNKYHGYDEDLNKVPQKIREEFHK
jgi:hypothetical protein